jgi:DNA-binding XRE family transcriptional regulator
MDATQLKEWRKAQRISQAELAKVLDVSRETIVRWEAGGTIAHQGMLELDCKQIEQGP